MGHHIRYLIIVCWNNFVTHSLKGSERSREPLYWLNKFNVRLHHGTLKVEYQRLVFFISRECNLAIFNNLGLQSDPLSVTLFELSDYHHGPMIVLAILCALDAVKLVYFWVRTVPFRLKADKYSLKVAFTVTHRHFLQLEKVSVRWVLHFSLILLY